jgi:hypothetical protein
VGIIREFIVNVLSQLFYDKYIANNSPAFTGIPILRGTIEFKSFKETKITINRRLDGSLISKYEYTGKIGRLSNFGDPIMAFKEKTKTTYHSENDKPAEGGSQAPFKPETVGNFSISCVDRVDAIAVREMSWTVNTELQAFVLSKNNPVLEKIFPGVQVGVLEFHRKLDKPCDILSNPEQPLIHFVWVRWNYPADLPYPKENEILTGDSVFGLYGSSYVQPKTINPTH